MGLNIISGMMVIWGMGILVGTLFRLKFYWDSRRMIASRAMFGNKRASILHSSVAVLMMLVGLWVIFG